MLRVTRILYFDFADEQREPEPKKRIDQSESFNFSKYPEKDESLVPINPAMSSPGQPASLQTTNEDAVLLHVNTVDSTGHDTERAHKLVQPEMNFMIRPRDKAVVPDVTWNPVEFDGFDTEEANRFGQPNPSYCSAGQSVSLQTKDKAVVPDLNKVESCDLKTKNNDVLSDDIWNAVEPKDHNIEKGESIVLSIPHILSDSQPASLQMKYESTLRNVDTKEPEKVERFVKSETNLMMYPEYKPESMQTTDDSLKENLKEGPRHVKAVESEGHDFEMAENTVQPEIDLSASPLSLHKTLHKTDELVLPVADTLGPSDLEKKLEAPTVSAMVISVDSAVHAEKFPSMHFAEGSASLRIAGDVSPSDAYMLESAGHDTVNADSFVKPEIQQPTNTASLPVSLQMTDEDIPPNMIAAQIADYDTQNAERSIQPQINLSMLPANSAKHSASQWTDEAVPSDLNIAESASYETQKEESSVQAEINFSLKPAQLSVLPHFTQEVILSKVNAAEPAEHGTEKTESSVLPELDLSIRPASQSESTQLMTDISHEVSGVEPIGHETEKEDRFAQLEISLSISPTDDVTDQPISVQMKVEVALPHLNVAGPASHAHETAEPFVYSGINLSRSSYPDDHSLSLQTKDKAIQVSPDVLANTVAYADHDTKKKESFFQPENYLSILPASQIASLQTTVDEAVLPGNAVKSVGDNTENAKGVVLSDKRSTSVKYEAVLPDVNAVDPAGDDTKKAESFSQTEIKLSESLLLASKSSSMQITDKSALEGHHVNTVEKIDYEKSDCQDSSMCNSCQKGGFSLSDLTALIEAKIALDRARAISLSLKNKLEEAIHLLVTIEQKQAT